MMTLSTVSRFFKPSLNLQIERLIFISAVFLHLIIFFTIATDNNGDPNEYIYVARNLFSSDSGYSILRFFGYPIFIKITSLNFLSLNLTLLAQHLLFIWALWFFAHRVTRTPLLRALIYIPALVPALAYLPNLLFPDSLILSLLLIFSASLYSRRYLTAGLICLCLILIKLVFVFLPIILLGTYLLSKAKSRFAPYLYFGMAFATLALVPAVFLFSPFPLYQSIVQKPAFMQEKPILTAAPNPVVFYCGGEKRVISDPSLMLRVTEHSSDWAFMPLGKDLAKELHCSASELKNLQRSLIISFIEQAPAQQLEKLSLRYLRNAFNFIDVNHVGYMMTIKYHLLNTHYSFDQYYEKTQLDYFKGHGWAPLRLPNQVFLRILNLINERFELLISWVIIFSAVGIGGLYLKRDVLFPQATFSFLAIVLIYSFCITFFALGNDRYLFINYFLWMGMISVCIDNLLKKDMLLQGFASAKN
jgi:hypothetical protein